MGSSPHEPSFPHHKKLRRKMRKLRLLFLATVLAGSTFALLPSIAHADPKAPRTEKRRGHNGRKMRHNQMEMMAKHLELTDAQKAKIEPIMEQSLQRAKKVRADKSLSREQKRAKMKVIRADSWKKISPILTVAQRKKVAEMRKNRAPHSNHKSKR
jgi:Spy/CpxP family protein refolding chaperone